MENVTLLKLLILGILITGFVIGMKDFRSLNGGVMRYGQGFGLGMLMTAIIGLLASFFDTVYKHFIDESVLKRELTDAQEQWERSNFFFS